MATIDKAFKIKNGLIVEGSTATVNGYDILTKSSSDQTYIIGLIGGSATPDADPDTVVLRDENADFSANMITSDLTGDVTGTVSDISNHNTDNLSEGTTNKYFTDGRVKDVLTNSTQTNISITNVGGVLHIEAENGVADSTTDDLTEGMNNKYYSDSLVDSHLSGGDGITYSAGTISADLGTGLEISAGQITIDRTTVDGWYDASGAAGDVATDLSTHESATTGIHGVTGNIVGTSDTQTLTNKTIGDILTFNDGSNDSTIDVDGNDLYINANNTLTLSTANGDLVLNPDGNAYVGSASAGNEIATHGYVDNAVSGLTWKQAVNLLYDDTTPSLSGDSVTTPLVIDGHTALGAGNVGYRILVSGGDNAGIYVYNQTGTSWTLDRAADADTYEELIGAAVFVMEGTQYGSTSWVQANHYLSAFTGQSWTQFSGQGSVTAGTGITVDGLEVSVDRTTVDTWYDAAGDADQAVTDHNVSSGVHGVSGDIVGTSDSQTLTNKTIDASSNTLSNIPNSSLTNSSITVNGNATSLGDSVTLDTDDISEGATNEYFTQTRARNSFSAGTAISYNSGTGEIAVDATQLDTDDIDEGINNHYFTDDRAKDAAGYLLENSTQSNISISYDENTRQLTVTAEDGFAGHDTDDLSEGTTNLYFTDTRAQDAVDGTTRSFTSINIDTYRTEEATQQVVASASTVTAHTFTGNKSVKYLVRTVGTVSGTHHSQVTELLATVDANDNVAVTEYGTIHTSENPLSTATVDFAGGEFRLRVTTAIASSEVIVAATIMSWAD